MVPKAVFVEMKRNGETIRRNHRGGVVGLSIAPPLFLFACYGLLAALPDLRAGTPEMLAITAMATIMIAIILYLSENGRVNWSPASILILAACFRLLFLLQEPQLSDDIHRYLFDGTRLSIGTNPYDMSPEQAARSNAEMAELAADVNHPELVTIYPPAAQIIFAAGAMLGRGIVGIKLVLICLDLFCVFLMMRLLAMLDMPVARAVLYAWNPLSVLEVASSGHIDGAAVMFVLAAMWLLLPPANSTKRTGRWAVLASGTMFSFAVLIKLFPIVLLPLAACLVHRKRMAFFGAGLIAACLLLILPFYPDILNALTTLGVYTTTWEFSGLAFRWLRSLFDSGFWARIILGSTFTVFWVVCFRWAVALRCRPVPTTDAFRRVLHACYLTGLVFLMVTPTLHPWYGLYLLAFLPFSPGPAGLILTWTITLGYRVLIPYALAGEWVENNCTPVLIWAGPAMAGFYRVWIARERLFRKKLC